VDTLQSLALLQAARSNRTLWCVLIADQQSYFSAPPTLAGTNKAPALAAEGNLRAAPGRHQCGACAARTDCRIVRARGCRRRAQHVEHVVSSLKQARCSDAWINSLKISGVAWGPEGDLPERHFALALDFATTEFQAVAQKIPAAAVRSFAGQSNSK